MSESRRIVLTGCSRGLGRAMTDGFVAAGHVVFGCARNSEQVEALQQEYGSPHQFAVANVASDEEVLDWAQSVLPGGAPDLVINNAAIINRNACLWEIDDHEFTELVDINIRGVANVIRHFVPPMVERKQGLIVNFSSTWGRSTSPEVASYCASKFAVEGLTQALADELPGGMGAIALNPGVINTNLLQSCFGAMAEGYPTPDTWAMSAVPYILGLAPKDNGCSLTVGF